MTVQRIQLQRKKNKKIYFTGDFHLGKPDKNSSLKREKKIISWLNSINDDAQDVFLLGDIFDFWFEYDNVIPKDNLIFLSTISSMIEKGINFHYFLGNHDLWIRSYFKDLGIKIYKDPQEFEIDNKIILIGHGDGLGDGDLGYKFLKKVFFKNKIFQFLYKWIHPDIGIPLGRFFSGSKTKMNISENAIKNDDRIINYCRDYLINEEVDFFIFGHSHFKNEFKISKESTYFNCGEWINGSSYLEYDSSKFKLIDY